MNQRQLKNAIAILAALTVGAGAGYLGGSQSTTRPSTPARAPAHRLLDVRGRTSTFGPPTEAGGITADGGNDFRPCIALRSERTLDHLFAVRVWTSPTHVHYAILRQCDWGPAGWTGRSIDITGAGAHKLGLSAFGYPTEDYGTAHEVK